MTRRLLAVVALALSGFWLAAPFTATGAINWLDQAVFARTTQPRPRVVSVAAQTSGVTIHFSERVRVSKQTFTLQCAARSHAFTLGRSPAVAFTLGTKAKPLVAGSSCKLVVRASLVHDLRKPPRTLALTYRKSLKVQAPFTPPRAPTRPATPTKVVTTTPVAPVVTSTAPAPVPTPTLPTTTTTTTGGGGGGGGGGSGGSHGPTDITLSGGVVPDNAQPGFVAGTLSAVEADPAQAAAATFALVSSAGCSGADNGAFAITGANLTTGTFNFGQKSSYAICVRATDGTGLTLDKAFTIEVAHVNQAPSLTGPVAATVGTGADLPLTGYALSDPDAGAANVQLTLQALTGTLTVGTSAPGGLTAADLGGNGTGSVTVTAPIARIDATLAAAGGLVYHAPSTGRSDTLTFTANDLGNTGVGGAETAKLTVAVTLDQSPTATPQAVSAGSGGSVVVTLVASDPENEPLTYLITSLPGAAGQLHAGTSVSGPAILSLPYKLTGNQVTYVSSSLQNDVPQQTFTFEASDGRSYSNQATVTVTQPDACTISDPDGCESAGGTFITFTDVTAQQGQTGVVFQCGSSLTAYRDGRAAITGSGWPVHLNLDYTAGTYDYVNGRPLTTGTIADLGGVTLTDGCTGDGNPNTIDLIVHIEGDGRTYGLQRDALKLTGNTGPTGLQITTGSGALDCGPREGGDTSAAEHQDAIQVQSGVDVGFYGVTIGDWDSQRATCWGAGGAFFISAAAGHGGTDITVDGMRAITCNHGLNGDAGGAPTSGTVSNSVFRTGRPSDRTDILASIDASTGTNTVGLCAFSTSPVSPSVLGLTAWTLTNVFSDAWSASGQPWSPGFNPALNGGA